MSSSPVRSRTATRRLLALGCTLVLLARAPALAQDTAAPQNYALLIGVDRYLFPIEGIPELTFAGADARELKEVLSQNGYKPVALVNEDATRENIVAELSRIASLAHEQDTFVLYFAGHGVRNRVIKTGQTYWLTYRTTLSSLDVQGLRLSHVLDYIRDIPAGRKLVILDHCFSGDVIAHLSDGGATRAPSGSLGVARTLFPTDEYQGELVRPDAKGLVVVGAARGEAYEFPDLKHGLFTYLLLEALRKGDDTNGDNKLSVKELASYLSTKLPTLAASKRATQQSIDWVQGSGLDNWTLVTLPASVPKLAQQYKSFCTKLEAVGDIDFLTKARCFTAMVNWEQEAKTNGTPQPEDQRIIDQLKNLIDLGDKASSKAKGQMLTDLVSSLQQGPNP